MKPNKKDSTAALLEAFFGSSCLFTKIKKNSGPEHHALMEASRLKREAQEVQRTKDAAAKLLLLQKEWQHEIDHPKIDYQFDGGESASEEGHCRRYGITPDYSRAWFNSRNGQCEICDDASKKLVVDHDHRLEEQFQLMEMRGLICHQCNTHLSMFEKKYSNLTRKGILKFPSISILNPERIKKLFKYLDDADQHYLAYKSSRDI